MPLYKPVTQGSQGVRVPPNGVKPTVGRIGEPDGAAQNEVGSGSDRLLQARAKSEQPETGDKGGIERQ